MKKHITPLIILALLTTACRLFSSAPENPTNTPQPDPAASDQPVLADWFVTICAYLDGNNSGSLDDEDKPMGGIRFGVNMAGGILFGGTTSSSNGCYTVTVPGGGAEKLYPMTVTIKIPEEESVSLLGSEAVELAYPVSHVDYLFAPVSSDQ